MQLKKTISAFIVTIISTLILVSSSLADDIPYNSNVVLKVGQSASIKGVRHRRCSSKKPPRNFGKLPKSKLGKFVKGRNGTILSEKCGEVVPALELRFVAKKRGSEDLIIKGDPVSITVK